jgi:hypothetical protein
MRVMAPFNYVGSEPLLLDNSREPEILVELDAECLDAGGQLKVMPADFYARRPRHELFIWCVRRGFYCLPTHELVEFIRDQIDGESALEIGAGNGCLGRSVGIPMTDSKQQEREDIKARYEHEEQTVITYGPDVEKLTALEAVEKYRPTVVLAAWVTHKYNRDRPAARGNMNGVDESRLLDKKSVKKYIFVGHERVHGENAPKPILSRRHETHRLPYLYSRSPEPRDVIWVWKR